MILQNKIKIKKKTYTQKTKTELFLQMNTD